MPDPGISTIPVLIYATFLLQLFEGVLSWFFFAGGMDIHLYITSFPLVEPLGSSLCKLPRGVLIVWACWVFSLTLWRLPRWPKSHVSPEDLWLQ